MGDFWIFRYFIQHCFICCPSDSTVSEYAGIATMTIATSALAVRRSNNSVISQPRSAISHPFSARSHPHSARSHPPRLDLIHTRLYLIHSRLALIHLSHHDHIPTVSWMFNHPFMYSVSGNYAASVPISTFMFVSDLYIPRIRPHISCSKIGISILGIYKSLTDTWMWKLGLWPRNSFSGNICFKFFGIGSLQCDLCFGIFL